MLKHSLDKIANLQKANRWIFETIEPYLGDTILDAGCGCGTITNFFLSRKDVVAVDIDEFHLAEFKNRYASKFNNIRIHKCDLTDMSALNLNGMFDSIVCLNTLEHIVKDELVLDNFHSILKPSGKLIISVPACKFLFNSIDVTLGHVRRYNKKELSLKLSMHGFAVEKIFYFNLFGLLGWLVTGSILRKSELPVGPLSIFDALVPVFRRVESFIRIPIGSSLFAICKKE